jgi:hypothetical protein
MRVYLAVTAERLRALAGGDAGAGEWTGFAPLDSVRSDLGGLGDDELEYALSVAAGEASAALGSDDGPPGRRLVVVADVDDGSVEPDPDVPGAVVVRAAIALRDVDAVLADSPELGASDGELGWFAAQEIADLLA